jgi:glycosyltransferase involved in cell wall biosynthesis
VSAIPPKVVHFASSLQGGANIAGVRLHLALLRQGVSSVFYHGEGRGNGPSFVPFNRQTDFLSRNRAAIRTSIWARRWSESGFVVGNRWIRKTPAPKLDWENTVVCLHWVSRWLDLPSFLQSVPKHVPIVWTLHDLIPITGGCANPYDCGHYKATCGFCPQLANPRREDMAYSGQQEKIGLFQGSNIHLVANSNWTLGKAMESALGQYAQSITKIHYGIDLGAYRAIDKETARLSLSLHTDNKFIIGFSCLDFNDERKGAKKLLRALSELPAELQKRILLLVLGGGTWPALDCSVEMVSLGSLSDSRFQSIFYSSLDLFVLASSSETFGNVVIEAMACGTPVVAFDCGGPGDTVRDGITGFLVPPSEDFRGLGERIKWMAEHVQERQGMGEKARSDVELRFSDSVMAENYLQLFTQCELANVR